MQRYIRFKVWFVSYDVLEERERSSRARARKGTPSNSFRPRFTQRCFDSIVVSSFSGTQLCIVVFLFRCPFMNYLNCDPGLESDSRRNNKSKGGRTEEIKAKRPCPHSRNTETVIHKLAQSSKKNSEEDEFLTWAGISMIFVAETTDP